jgi:chromosome segregation ATPase
MPFIDLIKNAIFEEEPQPKESVKPASAGSAKAVRTQDNAPVVTPSIAKDNQFYMRLAKQTELSAVPDLAKIESFAAPLAGVLQDKSLRYKAALATAQSQAGLTKEAIMQGFDSLLAVLDSSSASFNKQTNDVARTEVESKAAQISQLSASIADKQREIADIQQQVQSMQSQVEASKVKLQQVRADFAAAYARRKAEIQQQRKEFENILQ